MPSVEVRQVTPADSEIAEEWDRVADEEDALGVSAARWKDDSEWPWQVLVGAMEFVRDDSLESELRSAIARDLESVPGVTEVVEEDREVWAISGNPSGEALVRAVASAIEPFAARIRPHAGA